MKELREEGIRRLRCSDEPGVREFLAGLSPTALAQRFHAPVRVVPERFIRRLLVPVHHSTQAFVAVTDGRVVGLSQLVPALGPDGNATGVADVAVVVADAYRRQGFGRRLVVVLRMWELAGWRIRADVQADNRAALALARQLAPGARRTPNGSSVGFELDIPRRAGPAPQPTTVAANPRRAGAAVSR